MKKMKENPHEHKNISPYTMEGYLYVQEKRRCQGSGAACQAMRRSRQLGKVVYQSVGTKANSAGYKIREREGLAQWVGY